MVVRAADRGQDPAEGAAEAHAMLVLAAASTGEIWVSTSIEIWREVARMLAESFVNAMFVGLTMVAFVSFFLWLSKIVASQVLVELVSKMVIAMVFWLFAGFGFFYTLGWWLGFIPDFMSLLSCFFTSGFAILAAVFVVWGRKQIIREEEKDV